MAIYTPPFPIPLQVRTLTEQLQELLEKRRIHPELHGVGALNMEKEMRKRQNRELSRLARNLQARVVGGRGGGSGGVNACGA